MSNKVFLGLLVLAAGILVGWFVFKGEIPSYQELMGTGEISQQATPTQTVDRPRVEVPITTDSGVMENKGGGTVTRSVVTYTDSGFGPASITITQGAAVTFVNESSRSMWVASAVHPTHQLLPGFDQLTSVARNGTYEYTFTKVGTWKYHNHMNPADTGSVVVVAK